MHISLCSLVFMTRHVKHSATLFKTSNNHPVSYSTYTVTFTQHRVGTCMDHSVWKQISSEISYNARGKTHSNLDILEDICFQTEGSMHVPTLWCVNATVYFEQDTG